MLLCGITTNILSDGISGMFLPVLEYSSVNSIKF